VPTPWHDSIKKTRQLTVFAKPSVTGGAWGVVFSNAIAEFNALSGKHSLGVTFVETKDAPNEDEYTGTNVQFEAGSGVIKCTALGHSESLTVDGKSLGGDTKLFIMADLKRIGKAFIVVPTSPWAHNAKPSRPVGKDVMLVIAVHELIHACGLSNNEHNPDDVMNGNPQLVTGSKPADDKIQISSKRILPPLHPLDQKTIANIRSAWS
jgi:hypothetical protein